MSVLIDWCPGSNGSLLQYRDQHLCLCIFQEISGVDAQWIDGEGMDVELIGLGKLPSYFWE